jgi:Tol biopolymer transport system component
VTSSPLPKLLVLSVLAAASLAAAGTSAALAANEIAYDCSKLDICLLDPANPAAVTNLTDNGETSIDEKPVWSPDGKKVAFISNFGVGGSTRNLFVMEPEAPEQGFNLAVQVTHFTSGVPLEEPVWSPDGTRLGFVLGNSESNDKIEVANSNGTTATPLVVTEHGVHPSWSPDSGKIAFSYLEQVYTTVADGSAFPTAVAGATGNEPVWSPDGSRIAFGEHASFATVNLGIINPNGGTPITLTSGAQFIFASWSPSGSQVVYHVSGGGEDTHWRVANADGSGDHALPELPSLNPNGPAPSWSPSGNQIVYQGFYFGSEPHTNAVYIENTDGSGSVIPLTGDQGFSTYPSWRPSPSAAPPVFTPTSASGTPAAQALPVTLPKPTTVWITKRIFVTKGPDLTVIIGSYGCGGPSCGVSTEGKAKYAGPPAGLTASVRTKTPPKYKRRQVVVAKGMTTIAGGHSGPVKMKLTKAGIKLLGKQGSLKIAVLVTITIPGQKKIVEHRQVTVVLKKNKKKHVAA